VEGVRLTVTTTFGWVQEGALIVDLNGTEWLVAAVRRKLPEVALLIQRDGVAPTWVVKDFGEEVIIVDQTAGQAVETVVAVLGGAVIMEPIPRGGKTARALLSKHLELHHNQGMGGDKTMGTLDELLVHHATLHNPINTEGIPHIHRG
jgi:hypothetical protein